MVFEIEDKKEEAKAFVGKGTIRSSISAYHLHRAALCAEEPIAVAVQAILDKYRYIAATSGDTGFKALGTLKDLVIKEDRTLVERVFGVCAAIAEGRAFTGDMLEGIFYCAKKLTGQADILSGSYLEQLKKTTVPGIDLAIRKQRQLFGTGGYMVSAKAILDILNKGRRRRLLFPVE